MLSLGQFPCTPRLCGELGAELGCLTTDPHFSLSALCLTPLTNPLGLRQSDQFTCPSGKPSTCQGGDGTELDAILALEECLQVEMERKCKANRGQTPEAARERTAKGSEDREVPAPGGSWESFLEEEEVRLGWEDLAPWPLKLFP